MLSDCLVFCDCDFQSVCPLMDKNKRFMEASWWGRLTEGETGSCSDGWGHAQFSSCVQSCLTLCDPISFRMDWLDLLAVQGTLKSLLQHHSSKASVLRCSAFFTAQLSHPYMTTGKTIALTRQTFVDKVISLLLNMLSRLVITFLPRSKGLLISWLQSPSAVILH